MKETITPYKNETSGKKAQVTKMFDNISGNYDRLNRVISMGLDIKWRQNLLDIAIAHKPETILDIATGTGDLAILFTKTKADKIIGMDISSGMLEVAERKIQEKNLQKQIEFQLGDAENLRYDDNSFDIVSISYGIRNFENLEKGLSEILRVLKPTGKMLILETSVPEGFPMKQGYVVYTKYILPVIGKIFSKDKSAYSYLSESAMAFPYGKKLQVILEKVGFVGVELMPQSGGISTIYVGKKEI